MKKIISKIIQSIQKDGLFSTLRKILLFIVFKLQILLRRFTQPFYYFSTDAVIHRRRLLISKNLVAKLHGKVKYGHFSGFILGEGYEWGQTDLGNMLLGLYEKEVMEELSKASKNYDYLIDLGAADGYYAIGCLVSGMFDKTYCYEISEQSRKHLASNSSLNGVSDKIDINGIATNDFFKGLLAKNVNLEKCLLLCDIEGGEFELFDNDVLEAFQHSTIIIEIHEWHENGLERYQKLRDRASRFFDISELKTTSRDLSPYPEVASLNDNDRWLLCSEGRHHLMTWLVLKPKVS